jgi:hypothetical protein
MFGTREGSWLTVVGVIVLSVARVLAMDWLHSAMVVVDDWMQWLMSREQRRVWSEVRLDVGRAIV